MNIVRKCDRCGGNGWIDTTIYGLECCGACDGSGLALAAAPVVPQAPVRLDIPPGLVPSVVAAIYATRRTELDFARQLIDTLDHAPITSELRAACHDRLIDILRGTKELQKLEEELVRAAK